ncbi:MAG: ABC-2 family transporter protein [Patescibacteria group bacterium]
MRKYFTVFKISFQQEFAYKLNFIMWRVRNVLQIFLIFFLWDAVFSRPDAIVFGYDKAKILTYIFGVMLVRALVFSARSVDVPGEISEGNLTNYILKPMGYFKYWFVRDLSSKALNFAFSIVEFAILFFLLKPPFFWQTSLLFLILFLLSLAIANYLVFVIRFIVSFITFWIPELAWGAQFLFMMIITEFLSGSVFPLDILPIALQKVFYMTPFPYLLFFPLQVYLGKLPLNVIFEGITISIIWSLVLTVFMKIVWAKGLIEYRAEGR